MLVLVCTKAGSVFGEFLRVAVLGPATKGRVLAEVVIQEAGGR